MNIKQYHSLTSVRWPMGCFANLTSSVISYGQFHVWRETYMADDLIMDLNAEKTHHANIVDDNCYTSILWHHCVTWQILYAILLFWFLAKTVLTDLEPLSPTGFPAPFAILELLAVSNAAEICICDVVLHCIYCMDLCNLYCWYSNKLDLNSLNLTIVNITAITWN